MKKWMKYRYYLFLEDLSYFSIFYHVLKNNRKLEKECIYETIEFGSHKQQKILLVKPKKGITKKHTIFFVHGGGWRFGYAKLFSFIGRFFAKFGYATILADYRLVPKYRYPIQVEDTIESFHTGLKALEKHDIKEKKFIFIGHSAGGQLVTLLAHKKLIQTSYISGVISIDGPINFNVSVNKRIKRLIDRFVENENNYKEANPINYVNNDIPTLCIHAKNDPIVEIENSTSFSNEINKFNTKSDLIILNKGVHSNVLQMFYYKMNEYQDLLKWIEQFEDNKTYKT